MIWLILVGILLTEFPVQDSAFTTASTTYYPMYEESTTESENDAGNKLHEMLDNIKDKVNKKMESVRNLFDPAMEFLKKLAPEVQELFQRLQNPNKGGPFLKFTEMRQNDAVRLLTEMTHLPSDMQDKLINLYDMAVFTTDELKMLPTDIIQALTEKPMGTLKALASDKMEVLCDKLVEPSSHPGNLRKVLQAGINCTTLLDKINFEGPHRSQSAVLMEQIRAKDPPSSWTSRKISQLVRYIGGALSKYDIEEIQTATIRKSLYNISRANIPTKSVRHQLVKEMMAEYSSPTMWPQDFLASMGLLLEDMNVQQLRLLLNSVVVQVAPDLMEAGVDKATTIIALVKNMAQAIRAAPDSDQIAKIIPWMKTDVKFMKNVNITNLLEALSNVNVTFTDAETNMIAERLEKEYMIYKDAFAEHDKKKMIDIFTAIGKFVEGFDMDYLESLPTDAFPEISKKITHEVSRPKSKLILRKLGNKTLSVAEMSVLFKGFDLDEVDALSDDVVHAALPELKELNLPFFLGRKVVDKIINKVFPSGDHASLHCHDGFHRLGNLAKYVKPEFIEEVKIIPIAIGDQECDLSFDDITLTKSQVYALVDNIREMLLKQSLIRETSVFSSAVIQKLGKLVRGLTADDIRELPLDTDLLSVIEILSYHEDDLDFSQVEAVAEKIREYFDIANRNVLVDVDEIKVLQIGRFLQYLNSDFELPKFPEQLRLLISQEIGKSSLLKISKSKIQALLRFALENSFSKYDGEHGVTRAPTIDEHALMDLGNLRCGLTKDLIDQLTKEALEVHIEDIHACPWNEKEAEALAEKALSYNINILNYREQMATMGALLVHLKQSDLDKARHDELAEITKYVAKSASDVQVTIQTKESNGFIRERSSLDRKDYNMKRKRLMKTGFRAMAEVFGTGKCHELMRLKGAENDVADLLDMSKLKRCIDYIGSVDWNPDTARSLLVKIADLKKWGTLNERTVGENSKYILEVLPKLVIGLSEDEMSALDISSPDDIASIGDTDGFTEEKLEDGFNTWQSKRGDKQLKSEDIYNLQAFTCGVSKEYIQTKIEEEIVRDSMDILGKHARKCNRDKLNAYGEKLSSALGNRTESWKLREVNAMGSLIGGLPEERLSSLTKSHIKVIEPDVITHMPPDKVKEFTSEQLGFMTANQVSAISSMQRSYMSEEQMDELGVVGEFINGGVCVQTFDYTVVTIALAMLRQFLVFFDF